MGPGTVIPIVAPLAVWIEKRPGRFDFGVTMKTRPYTDTVVVGAIPGTVEPSGRIPYRVGAALETGTLVGTP